MLYDVLLPCTKEINGKYIQFDLFCLKIAMSNLTLFTESNIKKFKDYIYMLYTEFAGFESAHGVKLKSDQKNTVVQIHLYFTVRYNQIFAWNIKMGFCLYLYIEKIVSFKIVPSVKYFRKIFDLI